MTCAQCLAAISSEKKPLEPSIITRSGLTASTVAFHGHDVAKPHRGGTWSESQGFHDNVSFQEALEYADINRRAMGNREVMVSMVDADAAQYVLGHFLAQMFHLTTQPWRSLVLACLDEAAFHICKSIHAWKLCYLDQSLPLSSSRSSQDHYIDLGWLKVNLIQQGLRLGHSIFFTDIDILYFKDPLKDLLKYDKAEIIVADDVPQGALYNPFEPSSDGFGANIGNLVIRPSNYTEKFMSKWLAGKEEKEWDQMQFTKVLNEFAVTYTAFQLVILDVDEYAFACPQHTCGDIACKIAQYAPDWRETCPKEARSKWVSFHLACLDYFCTRGKHTVHRNFMYSQVMGALRTMDHN